MALTCRNQSRWPSLERDDFKLNHMRLPVLDTGFGFLMPIKARRSLTPCQARGDDTMKCNRALTAQHHDGLIGIQPVVLGQIIRPKHPSYF
jgi:hypothetical protein